MQRERASKSYKVSAYYVAKFVSELPFTLIPPIVFCSILYYMANLNPLVDRFLVFNLITCVLAVASTGLGMIISSFAPNVEAAMALAPPIGVAMALFGGFIINIDSLPVGAQWVPYLSIFYWAFRSYVFNEFEGETFNCGPYDSTAMTAGNGTAFFSCVDTGEQVLRNLSYSPRDGYESGIVGMVILTACFHVVAYVTIRLNRLSVMKMGEECAEGYGKDPAKDVTLLVPIEEEEEKV